MGNFSDKLEPEQPAGWEQRVTGALPPRSERAPDATISVIVKVLRAGYVPAGLQPRAVINDMMFTATLTWRELPRIASDSAVQSIAVAERIGPPHTP